LTNTVITQIKVFTKCSSGP